MKKYLGHIFLFFIIIFLIVVHYVNESSIPVKKELIVSANLFNRQNELALIKNDTPVDTMYSYFGLIMNGEFSDKINEISFREITDEEKIATENYIKNISSIEILKIYFFDGESIKNGNPDMAGLTIHYKVHYNDVEDEVINTGNYLIIKNQDKWYIKDSEFNWDESRLMLALNKDKDIQNLILKSVHSQEYFEEKNPTYLE